MASSKSVLWGKGQETKVLEKITPDCERFYDFKCEQFSR